MNFKLLDLSSGDPFFDIALEETLFKWFDANQMEPIIRLWIPEKSYVVLGTGQKASEDVELELCSKMDIPVIRRFSGGGTVVHSKGQLCFSFFLPYSLDIRLADISRSYEVVFDLVNGVLRNRDLTLSFMPPCDFAIGGLKVSGNASRRGKHGLLHHGTFLVDADLNLFSTCLKHPASEPEYRKGRNHQAFVTNISHQGFEGGVLSLKEEFIKHLNISEILELPAEIRNLCLKTVQLKYNTQEWNLKR